MTFCTSLLPIVLTSRVRKLKAYAAKMLPALKWTLKLVGAAGTVAGFAFCCLALTVFRAVGVKVDTKAVVEGLSTFQDKCKQIDDLLGALSVLALSHVLQEASTAKISRRRLTGSTSTWRARFVAFVE